MFKSRAAVCLLLAIVSTSIRLSALHPPTPFSKAALAQRYFGDDAPWFLANIPFLEIDDPEIQQIYYYRWKLYRSHLREIGPQGAIVTEFLEDVPWARHPFTDLNDSSSFHIMEGRWLRDPAYMTSLVDHLYAGGGNDRHFSESIAAATYAWTQVTGDPAPALRHLDAMQHIYNLWDDHHDATRGLYWIEPLLDATEYTISSIDASGAGTLDPPPQPQSNGFFGGFAFRPSINAYQFANAKAIAALSHQSHREDTAADYDHRAEALRVATLTQLWNPVLQHFIDIHQRSTLYVKAGDLIRGRELVGFVPWTYELPDATPAFASAWTHALNPSELGGKFGLRTVEPTYPRYLRQYRYDAATGLPECQWNGPSWPFQTSQALVGMANLLHDYRSTVTPDDYIHLLRQYTHMHLTGSGTPDIQEDYNPDTGKPIVGLPRSHHYNHSTYNDLILTGLLGIKPRANNTLEFNPILPTAPERPIRFFALDGLRYHGHDLTLIYDADGTRYHAGKGLTVFSDGQRLYGPAPLHRTTVHLRQGPTHSTLARVDLAVNVWGRTPSPFESDLPLASASSTAHDANLYQAIDGRLWFFPEIANGWSPATCAPEDCWYSIDLRHAAPIASVDLAFFSDNKLFEAPKKLRLQTLTPQGWADIPHQQPSPATPIAGGINTISFPAIKAQQIRILLQPRSPTTRLRLIEAEIFAPARAKPLQPPPAIMIH